SDQEGAFGQRNALFQSANQHDFLKSKMAPGVLQENALLNGNPEHGQGGEVLVGRAKRAEIA
ncbi:MAG TPA: hypothetical protein VMU36_02210, partial [Spirochaetia bacterium]|nr:hypothetical protein [Spirochaetia bacterium]